MIDARYGDVRRVRRERTDSADINKDYVRRAASMAFTQAAASTGNGATDGIGSGMRGGTSVGAGTGTERPHRGRAVDFIRGAVMDNVQSKPAVSSRTVAEKGSIVR